MVKTHGATSGSSKKTKSFQGTHEPHPTGVNEIGQPIPLQVIPPTLQISWEDDVAHDEPNLGHEEPIQPE
ncbi:hypothetical protein LIER_42282 [Lithospermum erythrorhizon]|uniref:Uncharacterized protein n=1 Tax=Lithospermum erythrorhizon TaxID=34254 RepID=A0AAV3RN18_LITER